MLVILETLYCEYRYGSKDLLNSKSNIRYYDPANNIINKTWNNKTIGYNWNGLNQLIKIENRNGSTEYRYALRQAYRQNP